MRVWRKVLAVLGVMTLVVPLLIVTIVLADASVNIGASSTAATGGLSNQTKSWFSNGYYWVAYIGDDGAANEYLVARSSANGRVGWSAPTTVRVTAISSGAAFAVDGNNVHLVSGSTYRLFETTALGAIAPLAAEVDLNAVAGITVTNSDTIAVDNASHAFIGFREGAGLDINKPFVIDNTQTDGTWVTGTNFKLNDTANAAWKVTVIGLSAGRMYAVYTYDGAVILGRLYSGGAWGAEETISTSLVEEAHLLSLAVLNSDDVHMVFLTTAAPNRQLMYQRRTYSTGLWSAEAAINTNVGYTAPHLTADPTTRTLRVFLMDVPTADSVEYYKFLRDTWDTSATAWFTDAAGIASSTNGNSWRTTQNNSMMVTYRQAGGAPFQYTVNQLNIPVITAQAETGLTMDRDGVTGGTFNYNLTDMGLAAGVDTWVRYGTSTQSAPYAYTSATSVNTRVATGATTRPIPTSLTPGATYYYRASADNWGWSAERSMVLTMPVVATAGATQAGSTITLYGNVTSVGVASSYYYWIEYGTTPALGSTTAVANKSGTGLFSASITAPGTNNIVYYRAGVRVGAVTTYGATTSTSVPSGLGGMLLRTLLRVVLAGSILAGVMRFGMGNARALMLSGVIGVIAFVIVDTLISLL